VPYYGLCGRNQKGSTNVLEKEEDTDKHGVNTHPITTISYHKGGRKERMPVPKTILRSEKHAQDIWQKEKGGAYETHKSCL